MNPANDPLVSIHITETGTLSSYPIPRVKRYPARFHIIPDFAGTKPKTYSKDVLKTRMKHLPDELREDIEFLIEYIETIEATLQTRLPGYTSIDFDLMKMPNDEVQWIGRVDSPYGMPGLIVYQDDMGTRFSREDNWLPEQNKAEMAKAISKLNKLVQPTFEECFIPQ